MARHPWVAAADGGVRFGLQVVIGEEGLPGLLEAGRLVDRLGFDGLFVFDHPALQADPWVALSALAAVTERVRLGSVVNCVPYRHPAMLARLAADLDNLSAGRLMLGLGIGWFQGEFRAFEVPFRPAPERFAALEEALAIVQGAWGEERFSFRGEHYGVEGLRVAPPPVQRPRPPIMIGGNGERVTLRLVARHADACNVSELVDRGNGQEAVGGVETIGRKLEALRRHCADLGRPEDEVLRTHFTLQLVLARSEGEAAAKWARLAAASTSPATRRAQPSAAVVGTPGRVAEHYRMLAEAGIQYFVVQLDASDRETIGLLAGEVVPLVRG